MIDEDEGEAESTLTLLMRYSYDLIKEHFMKIIALLSLLICMSLSWSALAGEQGPANAKYSSMKEKCKAMGERHGLSGDKMAAWIDRCMSMAKLPKDDVNNKGMSMDNMGGMYGINKQKDLLTIVANT